MRRGLRLLLRTLRRTAPLVLILAAGLALAAWLTAKAGDPALYPPPPGDDAVTVRLVANAWHSGLLLPREALARAAAQAGSGALVGVTERFGAYPALEIGWGDAGFYRAVPTLGALDWRLALRALFTPGGRPAVLHVVGIADASTFRGAGNRDPAPVAGGVRAPRRSARLRRPPGRRGPGLYEAQGRFGNV